MTSSEFRDSFITICMRDRDNRGDTVFITIEYTLSEQSHITHHTSHITHHASHITHHTSHITHHTSHITHHTSHITHHTSHITHHTSHITHHTSHLNNKCISRTRKYPTIWCIKLNDHTHSYHTHSYHTHSYLYTLTHTHT